MRFCCFVVILTMASSAFAQKFIDENSNQIPPLKGESEADYLNRVSAMRAKQSQENFARLNEALQYQAFLGQADAKRSTDPLPVEHQLQIFFQQPSFLKSFALRLPLAGNGWRIGNEVQIAVSRICETATKTREKLITESRLLGMKAPDAFWVKVFEEHFAVEKELCDILQEALPPKELMQFTIDQNQQLGGAILHSIIFRDIANVDQLVFEKIQRDKAEYYKLLVTRLSDGPDKATERLQRMMAIEFHSIDLLDANQFRTFMVLTGQMDSMTTLREHIERMPESDRNRILKFKAVSDYMQKEGNNAVLQPLLPSSNSSPQVTIGR